MLKYRHTSYSHFNCNILILQNVGAFWKHTLNSRCWLGRWMVRSLELSGWEWRPLENRASRRSQLRLTRLHSGPELRFERQEYLCCSITTCRDAQTRANDVACWRDVLISKMKQNNSGLGSYGTLKRSQLSGNGNTAFEKASVLNSCRESCGIKNPKAQREGLVCERGAERARAHEKGFVSAGLFWPTKQCWTTNEWIHSRLSRA